MHAHVSSTLVRGAALLAVLVEAPATLAVEPTSFEKFATNPDTAVMSSRDIGALTGLDATATITVLVTANRAEATRRVRGARIELSNDGGREQVYLNQAQLERLLTELDLMELAKTAASKEPEGGGQGMRVQGTESCWMPQPVLRILCPELVHAPDWSGLRLWTFGGARFEFRDRTSTELRALVEQAVTDLNGL